ncbi:MAG: 1,4-dihydroxy-2-naphthoate polyprenyltransferase [Cyclobacteriaceae bacterium]|nr:1,4-dihydroxy-2-naphthoate polyprenyltransferase [Cyclobacteriaceae bacterium]
MKINSWLSAFRLRTLPLALSCIGMGSFLAAYSGEFDSTIFMLCVLTTVFLQILSNLANDYGDFINGADHAERDGPSRAVQSGAISIHSMRYAVIVFVILSFVSGISLLYVSFGWHWNSILFFLGLGVLSILAAITYTAGRKPYGYAGLGDISVLLFFGLIGVVGSSYLFIKEINFSFILPAMSCGLFSVAVLNVNNIRDINSDEKAGKLSIPVRIGREKAVYYHWGLILGGLLSAVIFTHLNFQSVYQWMFLLFIPLFIKNAIGVANNSEAEKLDPYLKQMAIITLLFVIVFGVGLLIS